MRNIKTTLRTVRNSALLFAAASGMSFLTACQETDLTPDNGGINDGNLEVTTLPLTTGVNPTLAKTFYNSHQGTRAAFDVPDHPGMPALPEKYVLTLDKDFMTNAWAINVKLPAGTPEADYKDMKDLSGVAVYVPAGEYQSLPPSFYVNYSADGYKINQDPWYVQGWTKQIQVTNPKYYIDGEVTIGGTGQDGAMEIHLLDKSKFSDKSVLLPQNTVYLYVGGDILRANQNGSNNIHIQGKLVASGALSHGDADIEVLGDVYTYSKIHGKNVTLIGGEVYAGCAVTAEETIYLTGDNSVVNAGYVSAPVVELAGNSPLKVVLRDGGYLNATKELRLKDVGNVFVMAEDGDAAMVETDVLDVNNKRLQGSFYNVAIKYNTQIGTQEKGADEDEVVLEWNETTMVNGLVDYSVVDGDDCAPKMVVDPTDVPVVDLTPDPTPVLENVGTVEPTGDHTHPISATCIYTNGQDAYLSWHTQGTNFHGCIEYLTVANGTVNLNAYLETNPAGSGDNNIDFNHVIFDNGKIFVAGDHQKKGAILGWIECNDGKFVTGEAVLNMRQLYNGDGGSGNCIIRNGDYYQVASVKGFETYNVADFVGAAKPKAVAQLAAYDFDPTGGEDARRSGKHIATDGQKVVMLTLINRDNASNTATASIKVFNASDVNYENEVASYIVEDAVLSPVDGKDVIAINGDDIWVCLGKGGVQHLRLAGSSITKVSEFVLANMTKEDLKEWAMSTKEAAASCANGLAVDSKYVYVAHGGAGLVVLNKEDLSLVCRTRYNGGNSANYVNLNPDGYIYVAYGKSNVQVFAWKK